MNSDLNIATRRLLQVVLDMLSNPNHADLMAEREAAKARGEHVYAPPSPYRYPFLAVEAAFRAAREAQQMLAEAACTPMVVPTSPVIVPAPWQPTSPVTCEQGTAAPQVFDTQITCKAAQGTTAAQG